QEEPCVLHAERTGDPRADEFVERHARGALDDAPEDVGVVAVDPLGAGLGDERERRERLDRRANGLVFVGRVPPEPRRGPEASGLIRRRDGRLPYEIPAVCVSRSRIVIWRRAGTIFVSAPSAVATVVFAKPGMYRLTGSLMPIFPSSYSAMTAVLVIALDCDAMRKIVSVVILRPASLSAQPNALS